MASLTEIANRLDLTKYLLDTFSHPLTNSIAGMSKRPIINRGSSLFVVLLHVRCHHLYPESINKISGIIPRVGY